MSVEDELNQLYNYLKNNTNNILDKWNAPDNIYKDIKYGLPGDSKEEELYEFFKHKKPKCGDSETIYFITIEIGKCYILMQELRKRINRANQLIAEL
jgi:hypothetical protein